ncbi:glycosyltransferase family 2 protein [Sagittula sp. S175]|uniref:glycosyltransferase family 2 protein n=1 Tax=Sagittula sp. S175 TaxID=3415129 RepID=UPI003C7B2F63
MASFAPRISVIVPCYDCAATLRRAVASVLAQSHPVHEILLVDDCSRDDTRAVMTALAAEEARILPLMLDRNGGPSRARNHGWARATGDLIAFLDADDAWHPEKVALQVRLFAADPELVIAGHLCDVADTEDTPHAPIDTSDAALKAACRPVTAAWVKRSNPWSTPTVMLRRSATQRFAEDQRTAEDSLLWAQILLSGGKGVRIDWPLARLFKARYGAGGLSGNLWRMEKGELTTLSKLRRAGLMGGGEWLVLSGWSLAKHLRRLVLSRRAQ